MLLANSLTLDFNVHNVGVWLWLGKDDQVMTTLHAYSECALLAVDGLWSIQRLWQNL